MPQITLPNFLLYRYLTYDIKYFLGTRVLNMTKQDACVSFLCPLLASVIEKERESIERGGVVERHCAAISDIML